MAPPEGSGSGKQEAIEQLVSRLAEDVRTVRGGNPVSLKLRQTAVNVLSGRTIGAPGRWEKVLLHLNSLPHKMTSRRVV